MTTILNNPSDVQNYVPHIINTSLIEVLYPMYTLFVCNVAALKFYNGMRVVLCGETIKAFGDHLGFI